MMPGAAAAAAAPPPGTPPRTQKAEPHLTLYHCVPTRSCRVYWLLEELGLPFKVIYKPLRVGKHDDGVKEETEHFRIINPLGRVPTLMDGHLQIVESGAIMQYILQRYGEGRLVPETGGDDFPKYLQWMWYGEATLANYVTEYFQHVAVKPKALRVPAVLPDLACHVEEALAFIERELMEHNQPFILGPRFSAADIIIGQALVISKLAGFMKEDKYPFLCRYQKGLQQRTAYQKAFTPPF